MRWDGPLEDYLEHLCVRGLSPSTVSSARIWLWHFARFCGRRRPPLGPQEVLPRHVFAYRRTLQTSFYARSTQSAALGSIRGFFRWAAAKERIFLDPTLDLVVPRVVSYATLRLTVAQVEALLRPPQSWSPVALRNWALLETLYGTGVRRAECHALNLYDANLGEGTLWVRHGKGRQGRLVPLGPHLVGVLETYLRHGRPHLQGASAETALFVASGGGRLSLPTLVDILRQAGQRIGLSHLGAHALRRACASHTLAAGADLAAVQRLLGHASGDTTQLYSPLDWQQVRDEHARTHPRRLPPTNN